MSVNVTIPDAELDGFSDQATESLRDATEAYASDLVEEANRIEAGRNPTEGPPEITRGMVNDAQMLIRRGLNPSREEAQKDWKITVLRVSAAVLPLGVGIMYDETKLQESGGYLLFFIVLVAVAIISVTFSTIKE